MAGQACAACKYQRKKCVPDCPLAPYFPPDQPRIFQNAHKLFGVKNIVNMLKDLDQLQKNEAMRSIVYEANMRDKFPIHGCCGIIYQLRCQITQAENELHAVQSHLDLYRHHHHMDEVVAAQLELAMAPPNNAQHQHQHHQHHHSFSNNGNVEAYNASFMETKGNFWGQHDHYSNSGSSNNSNSLGLQKVVQQDCDEIVTLFNNHGPLQ